MKAERAEPKQEFVPVIVTLESQEEVDALFVVGNHPQVSGMLSGLNHLWEVLQPFASSRKRSLYDDLNAIIK